MPLAAVAGASPVTITVRTPKVRISMINAPPVPDLSAAAKELEAKGFRLLAVAAGNLRNGFTATYERASRTAMTAASMYLPSTKAETSVSADTTKSNAPASAQSPLPTGSPNKATDVALDGSLDGLTSYEADIRLRKFGPNSLPDTSAHPSAQAFFNSLSNSATGYAM